jgi:hypothetical protein
VLPAFIFELSACGQSRFSGASFKQIIKANDAPHCPCARGINVPPGITARRKGRRDSDEVARCKAAVLIDQT